MIRLQYFLSPIIVLSPRYIWYIFASTVISKLPQNNTHQQLHLKTVMQHVQIPKPQLQPPVVATTASGVQNKADM